MPNQRDDEHATPKAAYEVLIPYLIDTSIIPTCIYRILLRQTIDLRLWAFSFICLHIPDPLGIHIL